jgi:hypothetical protein
MNALLTYRGRPVTEADVSFLRQLIADHPAFNRRALSREVCRVWDWRQPNGVLKEGVCRQNRGTRGTALAVGSCDGYCFGVGIVAFRFHLKWRAGR